MQVKLTSTAFFLAMLVTFTLDSAHSDAFLTHEIHRKSQPAIDRESSVSVKSATFAKREIRDVPVRTDLSPPLLGEFSPIDVNDPEVKEIADFATTAISASSTAGPFRLIRIVKAASQVGIGAVNFKLTLEVDGADEKHMRCEVVVFDQSLVKSWTSICFPIENAPVKTIEEHNPDSHLPLLRGYSPIDTNDAEVKEIARFANVAISGATNSGPLQLVNIIKAEVEVVAGKNYKLVLELDGSEGESDVCEVVVFDQPWTNTRILSKYNCLPIRTKSTATDNEVRLNEPRLPAAELFSLTDSSLHNKREISGLVQSDTSPLPPGGFMPINVNDNEVKEIAEFASNAISARTNAGPITVVDIVMAESQVVAGKNYKLTLELDGSAGKKHLCEVLVFDQSWTKTRILSEFNCSPIRTTVDVEESRPTADGFPLFNLDDPSHKKPDILASSFRLNRIPVIPAGFSSIEVNDAKADLAKSGAFKLMKAITFWGRKKEKAQR